MKYEGTEKNDKKNTFIPTEIAFLCEGNPSEKEATQKVLYDNFNRFKMGRHIVTDKKIGRRDRLVNGKFT